MIKWSIRAFAKNVSCVCNVIIVSKCKRLSYEKIDDRIKKTLNTKLIDTCRKLFLRVSKFFRKSALLFGADKPFAVCFTQDFPHIITWSYHQ